MNFGCEIVGGIGKMEICACTASSYFKIGCATFFQREKKYSEKIASYCGIAKKCFQRKREIHLPTKC